MAGLVPAIPIVWSATPFFIGITGTRPVMTKLVSVPQGFGNEE